MNGRRFVTTTRGRFKWAPEKDEQDGEDGAASDIQCGDRFCIAIGCSVPLVARPQGPTYIILGEGYLRGYMDGELVAEIESGQVAVGQITFY